SDPLSVRWMALQDSSGKQVLIGAADLLSFSREAFKCIRGNIQQDVVPDDIFIGLATSHTHSAPAVVPLRHCGQKSRVYNHNMKQQVVNSALEAAVGEGRMVERIRLGTVSCDLNLNRRQRDKKNPPLDQ